MHTVQHRSMWVASALSNGGRGNFRQRGFVCKRLHHEIKGGQMNRLKSSASNHPVVFVVGATMVWLVLLMVFAGAASSVLRIPFGTGPTVPIGHGAAAACTLMLVWRLDWLKASGIARLGRGQVWLLALAGLIYYAGASLYSFYGRVALDLPGLRTSGTIVLTTLVAGGSEELLFRGLVLCALIHVWRRTRRGIIGSVVLSSLLFAVLHIWQVFPGGISRTSILLLILQACLIAIWWGALVLWSGSVWPAVILHSLGNAVVAVQGHTVSMIEPDVLAYGRIFWFSLPLGILAIALLVRTTPRLLLNPLLPAHP